MNEQLERLSNSLYKQLRKNYKKHYVTEYKGWE